MATTRKRKDDLGSLCRHLGYRFKDPELLKRALTHRSFANESPGNLHNELLEFVGDAVLGLAVSQALFVHDPTGDEGRCSRVRSAVVNQASLAMAARALGLGAHLRLGRGEDQTGGRDKDSLLSDAFEALLGAVFLEGGLRSALKVVERTLGDRLRTLLLDLQGFDPKSRWQESLQRSGLPPPQYRVVEESGPEHQRHFVVVALVCGQEVARGEGGNRKEAEQDAARHALNHANRQKEKT